MKESPILEVTDLYKTFSGTSPVEVLKGVDLKVNRGQTFAIMGKSGEGKSTLLHILGTLESPSKGSVKICGELVTKKNEARLRNQKIGFIFQSYHLLEDFTTLDNILMPSKIARISLPISHGKQLLKNLGLEGKENTLIKFLSGGEKQRVCIARALCNDPPLLLADEPTGNLDHEHSEEVQSLLLNKAKQLGKTLILVTHDEGFASKCDQILFLEKGKLSFAKKLNSSL